MIRRISTAALLLASVPVAQARTVAGRAISTEADLFTSYTPAMDFDLPGDFFGIRSRSNPDPAGSTGLFGLPFAIADDSLTLDAPTDSDPGDLQGIIGENDTFDFFGVVDNLNSQNEEAQTATWVFDITGLTDLDLSIDFAAMGDFEFPDDGIPDPTVQDFYQFDVSIDGGTAQTVFSATVDDAGAATYTMDSGATVDLNDPVSVNGTQLSNEFQNLSNLIEGTGSSLALSFTAFTDGGSEAFAFKEILLTGTEGVISGLVGDYDEDGQVAQGDLNLVLNNWGAARTFEDPGGTVFSTANVDQEELNGVLNNWGAQSAPSFEGSAVPEPATVAALGLLALAGLRRRSV
ncbi:MAG: PEP-CTERM sorting domain-containing protein [Planctomycetota bacterium]